jgi:UDP-N-acetylglucosamine--N-acetylmuramyl-(pentapeptide) pyrophosphoryl-undecaprenol N-acetylglucosamine transferase
VALAGGGTGGHLFPSLAIGQALRACLPDGELLFLGSVAGPEGEAVAREGWAFVPLRVGRVTGRGPRRAAGGLAMLLGATWQARRALKGFGVDVVVGTGAYVSVPVVLAARTLGTPVVLHEQNAHPGLANRLLARWAAPAAVAVGMVPAVPFFRNRRVEVTGNPVRAEVVGRDRVASRMAWGIGPEMVVPLVFGGSQGAHRINMALLEALPLLGGERERLHLIHATGEKDADVLREGYATLGFRASVIPFIRDMGAAYAAADFAICRAGASTLGELAAVGLPALLVPYPFAANDHQSRNAEAAVRAGAASLLADRDLTGEAVAGFIRQALRAPDGLRAMARQARALAAPERRIAWPPWWRRWLRRGKRGKAKGESSRAKRTGTVTRDDKPQTTSRW